MVSPYNYILLFADNFSTTLSAGVSSSATVLPLVSVTGLPTISGSNEAFLLSLTDAATKTNTEIVLVTSVSGNNATVVRGQEGTTAHSWLAGDIVANQWTAGSAASTQQIVQAQAQSANYAQDTGTVNHVVVALSPALVAHVIGMPIRVLVKNTNTGATDFNPGPSAVAINDMFGNALQANDIIAGDIIELYYNGISYNWNVVGASQSRPGTIQIATNAQVAAGVSNNTAVTPASLASLGWGTLLAALQASGSLGANGYIELPIFSGGSHVDTLIIQWGTVTFELSSTDFGYAFVDNNIGYPSACFGGLATCQINDANNPAVNGNNFVAICYDFATNGMYIRVDTEEGGSHTINVPVFWMSIGH